MSKSFTRVLCPTSLALTFVIVVCSLFGCRKSIQPEGWVRVIIDSASLQDGDLLFRSGLSGSSRVVTVVSDGTFSHIGLAFNDPTNGWQVVHAVPGENTDYIKSEPITTFFSPERAKAGGFAQVACSDNARQHIIAWARQKEADKVLFDDLYDLEDTTRLYCTEFIYRAFLSQNIDLADQRRHRAVLPGTKGLFIFPQDIWDSPHIHTRVIYNTQIFTN